MAHASIAKMSNGKYRVCFEYGFNEHGVRVRKHKTFATKREAESAQSRHNVAMEDGTVVAPQEITLKAWLEYWLNDIYSIRAAETSVYGVSNIINKHIIPAIGSMKLQRIKPMHIQRYYTTLLEDKKLSPNTVIKHHDLLNTIFKAAVKQEFIARSPIDGVERPRKQKHEAAFYTVE
ncbi:MAG: phage integrase SAM-like domain-containing protein, partial [Clostridia bacterium]|nr:phage integrase SAM-like domain-containing protein [Clostridia bacterium]